MAMTVTPQDLETHRPALLAHCYRMMASPADAEDAVQETLLKGWKNLDQFEGRASLKTWLTTIATRVCLDLLENRAARRLLTHSRSDDTLGGAAPIDDLEHYPLARVDGWVEPLPDHLATDPHRRVESLEGVRLAWITALQTLAPKQRAALLMAEVLDYSANEIAEALAMTVPAVNSALQRARDTLARRPSDGPERRPIDPVLVERFVSAFERYDIEALTRLLRDDAVMSMPPYAIWLDGPSAIAAWLSGRGLGCRGSHLLPTGANGQIAFGQYRADGSAWSLAVLEADKSGEHLESLTYFLDTAALFPHFGLPLLWPGV